MSLNKVIMMGRLTADPELRRTQQNTAVTSFTLAVDRSYAKPGEQKQTDFIDCVAWAGTAEFVSKWFKKGQLVAVVGRLQARIWEDKNGQKRKTTEVNADEAYFAESKKGEQKNDEYDLRDLSDDFAPFSDDVDGDLPF